MLLLSSLETKRLTDVGVKGVLQVVMILYLKHQKEAAHLGIVWGRSTRLPKRTTSLLGDGEQEYYANTPGASDNLYLRLVEPVCYLYARKDVKSVVRFYAQETLTAMCLKCTFLDRALVLEAVYECCVGKEDQVEIYNRFCDRLEQKHAPYLIVMDNSAYKLELPLLGERLFVADGEANTMNSD